MLHFHFSSKLVEKGQYWASVSLFKAPAAQGCQIMSFQLDTRPPPPVKKRALIFENSFVTFLHVCNRFCASPPKSLSQIKGNWKDIRVFGVLCTLEGARVLKQNIKYCIFYNHCKAISESQRALYAWFVLYYIYFKQLRWLWIWLSGGQSALGGGQKFSNLSQALKDYFGMATSDKHARLNSTPNSNCP